MAIVTTSSIITNIRGLVQDLLNTDGRNFFEYDSDNSFHLGEDRVSSTGMKVYQNGTELDTDDWTYNSDTNKVTITSTLTKGDSIIIIFNYYNKYSDSEIQSYIQANLARFVEKRYKKTFYLNDSNEIVTLDGINPTVEEGNIISLITAIDIDPQNIDINLPDFKLTAKESQSKREQIDEVFSNWLRNFGTLDFMEER